MIDYTQFGAQTQNGATDSDEDPRLRREAVQQPAGDTIPRQAAQNPAQAQPTPQTGASAGGDTAAAPAPNPMAGPTFAQLQAAGIPRPAPPPLPTMTTGGPLMANAGLTFSSGYPGSSEQRPTTPGNIAAQPTAANGASGPLGGDILAQIRQLLSNPTAYGTDAMKREYETGARSIDDDFALRQKGLNEEMARRGLYDSSIAAGNLSDLNIGRRSAQEGLMNNLLMKRADSQDAGIRSALQAAMGYDSDLANRGQRQSEFDQSLGFDKSKWNDQLMAMLYEMFGGTQ